jgi:hypothetical protein
MEKEWLQCFYYASWKEKTWERLTAIVVGVGEVG